MELVIAPYREIQADIVIHATPSHVWQAFRQIETWPRWYPGVLAATWQDYPPWLPQSRMHVQVRNSLRLPMDSVATVLPTGDETLLWENRGMGLVTLCRAQVWAVDQGALFMLHKAYRGPAALLLRALKERQVAMLQQGLANLKQLIERDTHTA